MAKKAFYVVWKGVNPGVYTTWNECAQQIKGFEGSLYMSFHTREEAERAFASSPWDYIGKKKEAMAASLPSQIPGNAVAVDAACSGNPGQMEYRGVYLQTGEQIFHFGPVYGTNNIGEFLAIVHALALLKQKGLDIPVYSDSRNALLWIKGKVCKTKLPRTPQTEELFLLIERAERWLRENRYTNPLRKWETSQWGEIPADFGRK